MNNDNWKLKWRDINPGRQTMQRCQTIIFSNIQIKTIDRNEYQRKTRIQRKITEKITKEHNKLN